MSLIFERFLHGENLLGHTFGPDNAPVKVNIVGVVKNRNM
jgi:hypothetical protein